MDRSARIYVAGHMGMVGSAIVRQLQSQGYDALILKHRDELDLLRQSEVECFFRQEKPAYVFLAAAKVGGILANDTYRAQFIYENLMIQSNVMQAAYQSGVTKLLFLGSSCIYPKHAPQPLKEDHLLTGPLETTNAPYAIAKIAGIEMCQAFNTQYGTNFISCMPTNLYGPNDNFDLKTSHVLPAVIRKFHQARSFNETEVRLWGTGTPRREFLHVDDLADAVLFLMQKYDGDSHINVGTGKDIAISELADLVKEIADYRGEIIWDNTKPDGTGRKCLDVTKLNALGWHATISLHDGIRDTYQWYRNNYGG